MFDFEKLVVYSKARVFNKNVIALLKDAKSRIVIDQLQRAALSISLNIAEGSGRFTKPDKRISISYREARVMNALPCSII